MLRFRLAILPLALLAVSARAEPPTVFACGGDLGFSVSIGSDDAPATLLSPFEAELAPVPTGGWANEAREVQFYRDPAPPVLFLGSEQFDCVYPDGSAGYDSPGFEVAADGLPFVPYAQAPWLSYGSDGYGQAAGWEIRSMSENGAFAGCGGLSVQPAGPLVIERMAWGWQIRVPSDQLEGFEGGTVTIDGATFDSQFGFAIEGYGAAGLDETQVRAIAAGSRMVTQGQGLPAAEWALAGSAAMLAMVDQCVARQGAAP